MADQVGKHYSFDLNTAQKISEYCYETAINGLTYWHPKKIDDERGSYAELARFPEHVTLDGTIFQPQQMNESVSKTNVIRGIHAENWNKLLTITTGSIFAAWTDLRPDSATYGATVTAKLGEGTDLIGSMFVEAGIGNSFYVTQGPAHYLYIVDQLYAKRDNSGDIAISVFDESLNIPWPIEDKSSVIISERDKAAISFAESRHDGA